MQLLVQEPVASVLFPRNFFCLLYIVSYVFERLEDFQASVTVRHFMV